MKRIFLLFIVLCLLSACSPNSEKKNLIFSECSGITYKATELDVLPADISLSKVNECYVDNVKFIAAANTVLIYDSQGATNLEVDGTAQGICKDINDNVYVLLRTVIGLSLYRLSENNLQFLFSLPNSASTTQCYDGNESYDIFFRAGTNLYGIKIDTLELIKILDFDELDIQPDTITNYNFLDSENFVFITTWYNNTHIFKIEGYKGQISKKQEITMAVFTAEYSGDMKVYIAEWNRANPQFRISATFYDVSNNLYAGNSDVTKFLVEAMAGKLPDIIDVSLLPIEKYSYLLED